MALLHPVRETDASESLRGLYEQIKDTLGVASVPLVFGYLGNFEEYLQAVLPLFIRNVHSAPFGGLEDQLVIEMRNLFDAEDFPDKRIKGFRDSLTRDERSHIEQTVSLLERVNAALFILFMAIRESVKGVVSDTHSFLPPYTKEEQRGSEIAVIDFAEQTPLEMSLALTGDEHALTIQRYTEFFHMADILFQQFLNTPDSLRMRVMMEKSAVHLTQNLVYPVTMSFPQVIHLIETKPHFRHLLYLLSDAFPSQLYKQLALSALMRKMLDIDDADKTRKTDSLTLL